MKIELGNIVKYHDGMGNVFVGAVAEKHPDGKHYLFARFNAIGLHGWFSENNIFFKVKDKCTEHNWDVQHRKIGDECLYSIVCNVCCARYQGPKNEN